jgi:hypothetical protein
MVIYTLSFIFASGSRGADVSSVVDMYNSLTRAWSTAYLSVARMDPVAASVGSVALFAGGTSRNPSYNGDPFYGSGPYSDSRVVDIFHVSTGKWSNASLSVARKYLAATTVGNMSIFAGGENSDAVDMFQLAITG